MADDEDEALLEIEGLAKALKKYPQTRPYWNRAANFKGRQTAKHLIAYSKANWGPEKALKLSFDLLKSLDVKARKARGEYVISRKRRMKAMRKRIRLKRALKPEGHQRYELTIAKEAREIQDMARERATAVIKRLTDIALKSPVESVAVAAGNVLLERAYGKANQTNTNVTVDANGKASEVTGKELDGRIKAALKRVEEVTEGFPGAKAAPRGARKAPASPARPADLRKLN